MLDDEPTGTDTFVAEEPTDRTARALEQFNVPGEESPPPGAAEAGGDQAAAAAAKPDAEKKAAEDKAAADKAAAEAAAAAGDDAKLPYFSDKRFQEIYKEWGEGKKTLDAFAETFAKGAYTIENMETLQGVLADSFLLYDIAGGKKSAAELLNLLKTNWSEDQFKTVVQQLADYAAAAGIKPREGADKEKPWEKEVTDLRTRLDARERAETEAKQTGDRMKVVDKLMDKVRELCGKAGFDSKDDKDEIDDYCIQISAELGRNPKAVEQLEKGQFGEVERLFTLYHNKILGRVKRFGDRALAAKTAKDKTIPKVPAGGAPPAPERKGASRRDLRTSEGRTSAAAQEWDRTRPQ